MKITLLSFLLVFVNMVCGNAQFVNGKGNHHKSISLIDELKTLFDISELPVYLDNEIVAQVSTFDTTGGNEDGFTGKYSYIRRNADSSLVIFDIRGPGVITRISTPTPTEDSLDFYIDDNSHPLLSIKYADLFSGKVFPFVSPLCGNQLGGYFSYFPILFQKNCRIICRGKKMQFHQIQYKLYPAGTRVKSFNSSLDSTEKASLRKVVNCWNGHPGYIGNLSSLPLKEMITVHDTVELNPGENKTIFSLYEGGRIVGIEMDPASAFEGSFKSVDIKINWDDDTVPAVYCPVADFFGYAFGKPAMQSLLLGTSHTRNYFYFPMPFDQKAVIQMIQRKGYGLNKPVKINCTIYYNKEKRDEKKEGRFYSSWNRYTYPGLAHVILNTKGKGHYVGTLLQAQGLRPGMTYFFEGDDSTSVDGRMRVHGTGSEDYFNGGWYALPDRWDRKMSLPLHGCLEYSLPFARTGGYRLYLSDKIPFEKSIFQSIEHGPEGNKSLVDYTSIGFYYANTAPLNFIKPTNNLTNVDIPDTLILYPQLMYFGIQGNISSKEAWLYNTGGLSYSFTTTNESGLKISLSEIPFGRYRLLMDFVQNDKGCSFSLWQGQTQLTEWISGYHFKENQMNAFYLADFENSEFNNGITIQFKTFQDRDNFILNRMIFVRRTE